MSQANEPEEDEDQEVGEPPTYVAPPQQGPTLWGGFLAGLATALGGGFLWGLFEFVATLHLDLLPLFTIGAAVGVGVAEAGRGKDWRFCLIAIVFTFVGYVVSHCVALWGTAIFQLAGLPQTPFHIPTMFTLYAHYWRPADIIIYACGAVESILIVRHWTPMQKAGLAGEAGRKKPTLGCLFLIGGVIVGGSLLYLNVERDAIEDVVISADGRKVAVAVSALEANRPRYLVLWDVQAEQGTVIQMPQVGRLAFSPDAELLAVEVSTTNRQGGIRLWHVGRQQDIAYMVGHTDFPLCVAFAPDGKSIASGSQDNTAKLWDVAKLAEVLSLPHDSPVNRVAFSADGHLLAAGLRNGFVSVWDLPAQQKLDFWRAHDAAISGLVFAPDGKSLVTAGGVDATVKVWQLGPVVEMTRVEPEMDWIKCLAFAPDGKMLAVGGGSFHRPGSVVLYDWPGLQEQKRFETEANTIAGLVLTRNGQLIAGTAPTISPVRTRRHSEVYRWDVATGKLLEPIQWK